MRYFTGEEVVLFCAPVGASGAELLGLFEAVAVGVDFDDLGAVYEAIDERDDAGRVREYFVHSENALFVLRSSGF